MSLRFLRSVPVQGAVAPLQDVGHRDNGDEQQGRAVLLNSNMAELLKSGEYDRIETELDPAQKAKYRYPENLWKRNMQNAGFLPKVKGA